MSYITRGKRDDEFEEFLRYQNSDNSSTEVVPKKDLDKMKKLYNFVKDFMIINEHEKRRCSDGCRCPYSFKNVYWCRLFDEENPYGNRCESCVEIFGD